MKKIFSLIFFVFLTAMGIAQITITDADMPSVNDTIRLSETLDIQGVDYELTGANYSWNFSTLLPFSQRIDTFFSVTSTPFAYQFFFNNGIIYPNHKASFALRGIDIGIPQVPITEVFNYVKKSSSGYDNVGFGSNISGIPSSTQNVPVDREYEFPMNYNNNHISTAEYGITVPGFGYYGQTIERVDTVDGWGTLDLPNGSYSVLRVKSILNKVDTTYIDQFSFGSIIPRLQEIEYKWLAQGKGLPLLKIVTSAGFITSIEYQDDATNVDVDEVNEANNIELYPNPAQSSLIIEIDAYSSDNLTIKITSVLGTDVELIQNEIINPGKNRMVINLMQYSIKPGIYFVNFELGDKQHTEKIIVVD